ncbi:enoyl-CoA hydratase/isomerase family protein [Pedomonas sp. V897]|uniref:enoyl-CoA hydratase/isomerase family protein n=1 Tax=Pedomonas sp. V897 TaxID=3446482 RepID=UPI003EE297D4
MNTPLQIEQDEGVLRLTKTNPEAGYGMSLALIEAMTAALAEAREDPSLRAVLIDAAGKGFHSGAVAVTELGRELPALTRNDFRHLVALGHGLGQAIAALPVPVIGVARAGALGGGLELLLRCDFLYCTDAARFSFPEVTLGFVAAWGGTQLASRLMPFRKAQEMLLLGEPLTGREAEALGLVTRSLPDAEALDAHLAAVLDRLRLCSPASLRWTKECLRAVWDGPLAHGERVEALAETEAMASGDFLKGLAALREGAHYDYAAGQMRPKARRD